MEDTNGRVAGDAPSVDASSLEAGAASSTGGGVATPMVDAGSSSDGDASSGSDDQPWDRHDVEDLVEGAAWSSSGTGENTSDTDSSSDSSSSSSDSGGEGPASGSSASGTPDLTHAAAPAPPRGRKPAASTFFVPGGKLVGYATGNIIVAECSCAAHGKCIKEKTVNPSNWRSRERQGRPIGYLGAWLAKGLHNDTKADHWREAMEPTLADRNAFRAWLKTHSDNADVVGLLGFERAKRDDEESEPEHVP